MNKTNFLLLPLPITEVAQNFIYYLSIAGCETLLLTIINIIRDTSISTFARKLDAMDEKIEGK